MPALANDIPVIRFQCIDSTSAYARREAASGRLCRHPMAFVAHRQVSGVGRFGRRWESPAGGLWMTLAWPVEPECLGRTLDGLGLRVGVACRRVVAQLLDEQGARASVGLKWPNDVLVDGRKVVGVLTELVSHEQTPWLLVGVGLNANLDVAELPPPVDSSAGTLRAIIGREVNLDHARLWTIEQLAAALQHEGLDEPTLTEARENLYGTGQRMKVSLPDGSRIEGLLLGLDDDGGAVFDVDGKRFAAPSGATFVVAHG